MSAQDIISANQRLKILQLIEEMPGRSCADYIVQQSINNTDAFKISSDKMQSELAWLEEQDLITREGVVAKLTTRGSEVARQIITHPGVARPLP